MRKDQSAWHNRDGGRFLARPHIVMESDAFKSLTGQQIKLLLNIAMQLTTDNANNGRLAALPIVSVARVLGVPPGTLRRWIRQGCPTVDRGQRGRGHACLVDADVVRAWRRASRSDALILELAGIYRMCWRRRPCRP